MTSQMKMKMSIAKPSVYFGITNSNVSLDYSINKSNVCIKQCWAKSFHDNSLYCIIIYYKMIITNEKYPIE